ncbi:GPR125 [Symbiodinium natans]|uniref:GPR125 protein n=1 Tax=Symbiodinium natans TaxID=878477 RepID=A0A812QHX4_9DINO|nr:GPR125 [Symbiodinium natans]
MMNRSLASHFALAALFGALVQGEDTSRLLEALAADLDRRVVQLSFTGCRAFRDLEAQMLLQALPRLSVLRLDLGFTAIQKLEFPEMPSLTELVLRFTGSSLRDASGLCAALTPRLQLLHLWFANLPSLQQLGSMSRALAALRVEELVLHLSGCPNVPPETKQQMYDAAQRLSRLRWRRLDAWIHIEGAERPWRGKPVAQENCGEPAFPSPHSKTSSPVLQNAGSCGLQGTALEDALPFPCSHPGCATFHENLQGFCQQHRLRGRARVVMSRCLTAWRWLELMLLFFAQAAAEMESRAALLAMLLSMYAVAVWPVIRSFSDSNSPSSTDCFVAALSAAALGSLAWTWRQFDRLQRVARQVALSTEASYSAVLEAKRAGEAEEEGAVRLLGPSTLTEADEGLESYGSVSLQQASADLSHLYCEARRHLPHLESTVREALADLPAPATPAKIRLLTDLRSEDRQRPQGLVDLLSCEVNCKDMSQVQTALAALKARLVHKESCGYFELVALHDGFATLSSRKCCQVVVSHQGYLASIFLLDASLARLQADMTDMYRLADSFGLLDEVKPRTWETSRRLWEPRPPRSVIAVTTFLRVVALLVALFFAVQYFVRYAPARWRKKLPGILLEATFVLDATASDRESWGQAILLSLPYAILVQVFAWELLPATGSKKRAKPTQVIYEKYFGLCGSHYVLKVLVLQFGSVLLQVFGKLRLLGALVTLAQHEAAASAEPFARVFWGLCALLAWNCVYPALLLVLPDTSWLRGGAALMDAVMDLASMLGYLLMVLMALVQLQAAEELQGNYGLDGLMTLVTTLDFSTRVPPGFAFPTGFWGYAAVYVNVAHVCCVCRMLRRSSWAVASVRQSRQKGRKGWKYLGAAAYASCLLLVLSLFLMSKDAYPGHSGDFRCFPCHCSVAGTILRLERCPLAEVLQMEQMSLHGRNITDIAAEAFGPLGQLRRLSLSGNPLVRLPPGRFEGLRCLQLLDLGDLAAKPS